MSNRRTLIVGNWKMNGRLTSGLMLAKELVDHAEARKPLAFDVVLCPPLTLIWPVAETLMGSPIMLGAQNCHALNHGAYTGEVSAGMLTDLGCRYVILGHSERRAQHNETNAQIAAKVTGGQLAGLTTIVCVGETHEQRAAGKTEDVITHMLASSLPENLQPAQLVIAYEPVWAIGSGELPSIEDIERVHAAIRRALGDWGSIVPILYGGSVAPNNAAEILASPEVDGVLVGGASLNSDGFWAIAEASDSAG